MKKQFNVDIQKKKEIQNNCIRSSMGAFVLSFGIIGVLILFNIYFLYFGLIRADTFIIKDITDSAYGEKNTLLVWTILIAVDVILAFLWGIQKIAVYRIFGQYISERKNESLEIKNDVLEYGYQNAVNSYYRDRVIVQIPLADIKEILVDRRFGKMEIFGSVSSTYYEDYQNRITRAPENSFTDGSFVLFDYFDPELIRFFEERYKELMRDK